MIKTLLRLNKNLFDIFIYRFVLKYIFLCFNLTQKFLKKLIIYGSYENQLFIQGSKLY